MLDLSHLAPVALPLALAGVHRRTPTGGEVAVRISDLDDRLEDDIVVGAGFARAGTGPRRRPIRELVLVRERSLPDTVGADMRVLVCGLNPSPAAADAGVGFFRAGNRFWPAAIAAGLVSQDRDPTEALRSDGVGMTDLAKRTTSRADELDRAEYVAGIARLDRLCRWLGPAVVVLVGLAGWRAAVDRRAVAGVQPRHLGDRPVYLMPSTSGLNAATSLDDLVEHLRRATALATGRIAR